MSLFAQFLILYGKFFELDFPYFPQSNTTVSPNWPYKEPKNEND